MARSSQVAEVVEHFQWLTEERSRNLPPEKLAKIREENGELAALRASRQSFRSPARRASSGSKLPIGFSFVGIIETSGRRSVSATS